ncbi:MAG: hypothetical protein GX376_01680 [Firmicutes bacterium]|nr:hypothetical protein [Bacillota bacterium]
MGLLSDLKKALGSWSRGEESPSDTSASWDKPRGGISPKLLLLGIIGLVVFLMANFLGPGARRALDDPTPQMPEGATMVDNVSLEGEPTTLQVYEQELSSRLAKVLAEVQDAGEVLVYVSLISGPEYDYARNKWLESRTTEEKDTGGGQRRIEEMREENQLIVAASSQGAREGGLVQKELHPPVRGVLIVAEGAEDSRVKAELVRAAQVVLGIGSHQVVALPKER